MLPELHRRDAFADDLSATATAWMDGQWDEAAALLRSPARDAREEGAHDARSGQHHVRATAWYALGLLMRGAPGDDERACSALGGVLDAQFNAPATVYHGTFRRTTEEPDLPVPPAVPTVWRDYDPNWREFIGTILVLILADYETILPAPLVARITRALRLATEGAFARAVPAAYTNIALMSAFLLCDSGERFGETAWQVAGEALAVEVTQLFRAHDTFGEYNSPTYYGVDLFALALWRSDLAAPMLREAGAAMEADLWRDIARFYHAGMRNLCGPFDRAYGMDMTRYAALVGLWTWAAVGREAAAFPDPARFFDHEGDFCFGPCIARVGAVVPEDVLPHLHAFAGERQVERIITASPLRIATAWLSERVMLGAEEGRGEHWNGTQFHPATAHWVCPDGSVGWLRVRHTVPLDARASAGRLSVTCPVPGDVVAVEIVAAGVTAAAITPKEWHLPGIVIAVETNAPVPTVTTNGDMLTVQYVFVPDADAALQPARWDFVFPVSGADVAPSRATR